VVHFLLRSGLANPDEYQWKELLDATSSRSSVLPGDMLAGTSTPLVGGGDDGDGGGGGNGDNGDGGGDGGGDVRGNGGGGWNGGLDDSGADEAQAQVVQTLASGGAATDRCLIFNPGNPDTARLIRAALSGWRQTTHWLHHNRIRDTVEVVLLVALRLETLAVEEYWKEFFAADGSSATAAAAATSEHHPPAASLPPPDEGDAGGAEVDGGAAGAYATLSSIYPSTIGIFASATSQSTALQPNLDTTTTTTTTLLLNPTIGVHLPILPPELWWGGVLRFMARADWEPLPMPAR
jgi:hypothetical protein